MVTNKIKNSAASGTKAEQHVGPGDENRDISGMEDLFKRDPYALSSLALEFIWEHDRFMNDETLRFVRHAFIGFRDEVQDQMVDCLRVYYSCNTAGDQMSLPPLGVEHIDLLMNEIVYKIDHGYKRY